VYFPNGPHLTPNSSFAPALNDGPCQYNAVGATNPPEIRRKFPESQNYNIFVDISEQFATQLVARSDQQQGAVQDFILGANVVGQQTTTTSTRMNFVRAGDMARIELQLQGEVRSSTVGSTQQARIHSIGRHEMLLVKPIQFDGLILRTQSPGAYVRPCQQNVGAETQASGIPIIGPIASNIAWQTAESQKGASEAITAKRITDQAAPAFNAQVDAELGKINQLLTEKVQPTLRKVNLMPEQQLLMTSDQSLFWGVQVGPRETVPLTQPPDAPPGSVAFGIHDSLLNYLLGQLPVAGRSYTDREIDSRIESLLQLLGEPPRSHPDQNDPSLATIEFVRERPLEIRFENETLTLIIRAGIQPVGGPAISPQEISIPFTIALEGEQVKFRPGEVSIRPADPSAQPKPLDEIARQVIRSQVQGRLAERTAQRTISIPLPDAPATALRLRNIVLRDGWLSVISD